MQSKTPVSAQRFTLVVPTPMMRAASDVLSSWATKLEYGRLGRFTIGMIDYAIEQKVNKDSWISTEQNGLRGLC